MGGDTFAAVGFKIGEDFCQVCTRPRSGARGWRRIPYESDLLVIPVGHEPSSSSQSDPPVVSDGCEPSSSSNQLEDPLPPGQISIGRLSVGESVRDEPESDSPSEVALRNLSSVAALTTHAISDDGPDSPIEIDFERVVTTSIPSEFEQIENHKVTGR